jgi:hypothetical protein
MATFTREDYELAAKAAGIETVQWMNPYDGFETKQGDWNPPEDDGDAFRLAVAIGIKMRLTDDGSGFVMAVPLEGDVERVDPLDPTKHVRYALFRAAITLGRAMP